MATTAAQDKIRKPLAFETTDPRGNIVICAQSVFDGHIAKDHVEMAGRLSDVQAAVADPDAIRTSTARPDAQVFEWVAADSIQIRVVLTYDELHLIDDGKTIAKVNSAFPVQPAEYDKPRIGDYLYTRPQPSNEREEGER